ncbi:nuclear transport factor 2 family protein [Cupriavidus basilensis]
MTDMRSLAKRPRPARSGRRYPGAQAAVTCVHAMSRRTRRPCGACFVPDGAHIHYDRIGSFAGRDALVRCFTELACRPTLREMHFAGPGEVRVLDDGTARGSWDLATWRWMTPGGARTFLAGRYADEYVCIDGTWLIRSTVFSTGVCIQNAR